MERSESRNTTLRRKCRNLTRINNPSAEKPELQIFTRCENTPMKKMS